MRFEARPIPHEHDEFIEELREQNQQEPFSVGKFRETAERVQEVAKDFELRPVRFRGTVETAGMSVDRVWAVIGNPKSNELYVVDPSLPLQNKDFIPQFRAYIRGDMSVKELEEFARKTNFDERVIGIFPDDTAFFGEPVFMERNRFRFEN